MTNQMKIILLGSLIASGLSLVLSIVGLFVGGFGYLNIVSYAILALSAIVFVVLLVIYLNTLAEEQALKRRIAYYRLLKELRNNAVLDFYNKFGLKPQYNEKGELLTPDEFLGIITKLDKEGKLDPSIYERLGILPVFDKDGKEIPTILVLKHLIRAIKLEGLKDLKKLKGLYAKGTKQEKSPEKKDKPKSATKKEEKKAKKGGKKDKGGKSILFIDKKKDDKKKDGKKPSKNGEEKPEPKIVPKKPEPTKEPLKPEPIITTVKKADLPKKSDYISKMYRPQDKAPVKKVETSKVESGQEYGECTPE